MSNLTYVWACSRFTNKDCTYKNRFINVVDRNLGHGGLRAHTHTQTVVISSPTFVVSWHRKCITLLNCYTHPFHLYICFILSLSQSPFPTLSRFFAFLSVFMYDINIFAWNEMYFKHSIWFSHGSHRHNYDLEQPAASIYEGKVKSSRPILCETRDERPLGRDPDRSWCHRHTKSMINLF